MSTSQFVVDTMDQDRTNSFCLHGWRFRAGKGPIARSEELDALSAELDVKLPSMVFTRNAIEVRNNVDEKTATVGVAATATAAAATDNEQPDVTTDRQGFVLRFDPVGALREIGESDPKIQVQAAKDWDERRSHREVKTLEHPSDWTFSSPYTGEVVSGVAEVKENTEKQINYTRLRRRDVPVLFFNESILFEDELDDNGVSNFIVRMRVSDGFFLILARFYLRVDGVLTRMYDTRYYHEFGTNFVIKDCQRKQIFHGDIPDVPLEVLRDPERMVPYLKTVEARRDEYVLEQGAMGEEDRGEK